MRVAQLLVEKRSGMRYRLARLWTPIYRRAFGHFGRHSVVIAPLMLQGVNRISIGRDVLIRDGGWLAAEGDDADLRIGDETYIGHGCHLHSIDPVTLGKGCVLADNVMVSSTDHDRVQRHLVHGVGPVVVGDDVFIGQNAVILGGVRIGDGATVAAGAVVVRDVPARTVVAGVPARPIGHAE